MKRIRGFLIIFLLVLVGYYLQPIIFPAHPAKKTKEPRIATQPTHTSLKYESIAVSGYAGFIDQPLAVFEQEYGLPITTQNSGFFYENRIYSSDKENSYLEVSVKEGLVSSIKVFNGQDEKIAPFRFNMSSDNLTKITTIYPNFSFEYDQEPVAIELTEEDMNYRPLIAFENGSFATLFFDHETKKLLAVQYFDKEMLLRVMPYKIDSGNPLAFRVQEENTDWPLLNSQKESEIYGLITLFREKKKLPPYGLNVQTQAQSKKILHNFIDQPEKILSAERLEEWQDEQTANLGNQAFTLSQNEFKKLAKEEKIEYRESLFYSPVVDPAFSMFYWLSDQDASRVFTSTSPQSLGVAFDQENVVILVQKKEKTKESESH